MEEDHGPFWMMIHTLVVRPTIARLDFDRW